MSETRAPYTTTTHRAFIAIPAPPRLDSVLREMTTERAGGRRAHDETRF